MSEFLSTDFVRLLAATLAATNCAILGNQLVLRREAMLLDALSHSVLPGLVVAFWAVQSTDPIAMLVGGVTAGLASVLLIGVLGQRTPIDSGTRIGSVFSVFFSVGILLFKLILPEKVHISADCVLEGELERLIWIVPAEVSPWSLEGLGHLPGALGVQVAALLASIAMLVALRKELRMMTFDPGFAHTQGFRPQWVQLLLMAWVAIAAVAAFKALGSILVIALFVGPPAAARLISSTERSMLLWSLALALAAAWIGPPLATDGLPRLGLPSVSAAGLLAAVSALPVLGLTWRGSSGTSPGAPSGE